VTDTVANGNVIQEQRKKLESYVNDLIQKVCKHDKLSIYVNELHSIQSSSWANRQQDDQEILRYLWNPKVP